MKKVYVKPSLEVIAFELNEAVASCSIKLGNNFDLDGCGPSDDYTAIFSGFEGLGNLFGTGEGCEFEVDGYCYFTSTGGAKFLLNS